MQISDKRTGIVVLIGILWVVIAVLGWNNQFMPAMYLGIVLMFLHLVLGSASKGTLKPGFLVFPLGAWAILWVLSFALAKYHADVFRGVLPDFTILGFHPSFAWTVLTYWLGGVATLSLGFVFLKDQWLSREDWDDFTKKIRELNEREGK
jgi:hypothetical protein